MKTTPKILWDYLDMMRMYNGMTAKVMCEKAGITNNAWTKLKYGKSDGKVETLLRICEALDIVVNLVHCPKKPVNMSKTFD